MHWILLGGFILTSVRFLFVAIANDIGTGPMVARAAPPADSFTVGFTMPPCNTTASAGENSIDIRTFEMDEKPVRG